MSHLNYAGSQVRNLNHLRQIHAHIIHHSLHGDNYWVTLLLGHCARLHVPLAYARRLFDSTPHPNMHCFTSMLKFYSQLGDHDNVILLFARMRECDMIPDAYVFPILIKFAGNAVTLIHAHILKMGHASDPYVRNAVMDAYAKRGPIETARRMFDDIPEKTLVDWNAMVSGYWRWGNEYEAQQMFDLMPERNVISWTAMVSGYSKHGKLEKARMIFDSMPKRSVVSWNALLSGYAQNGLAEEVLALFARMMDAGCQPDETTLVTVISACSEKGNIELAESLVGSFEKRQVHMNYFVRTALVDMYSKCGCLERARQIFDEMPSRNIVCWNAMISGYARASNLVVARQLFDKMPEKNVVSWNSMISGYAQNGQWTTAIELFSEMAKIEDVKPDEVTMVSVVSACGHLGALETGRWAASFISRNQIRLSISGYNSLVFMYSRCGSMEEAKKVFQKMPTRDIISYNSLITGFGTHGNGLEALDLMTKMKEEGIEPDRITFIGILTACSHSGLLNEGRQVFETIETPTVDHYSCMVDLLGRAGQLDEAQKLIDNMPMEPHAGVFGALLNASRVHRRVDLAKIAANRLFELEPQNSGNYVLLGNIYAVMGKWKDLEGIRQKMRQRGVNKTVGCSWVEFDGKVHRFIAGDQSHCRSPEIYKMIEQVGNKLKSFGYTVDKSCAMRDVEDEEKEEMLGTHSEKLAVAFGLLVTEGGAVIRVVKNLRICGDCHLAIKMISRLEKREIIVRDTNRFHCFKDGECSCKDYW